jgi:hypothetical protein
VWVRRHHFLFAALICGVSAYACGGHVSSDNLDSGIAGGASCFDNVQDNGETGVDCGGPNGCRCELGQPCSSYVDCVSEHCTLDDTPDAAPPGLCVAPTCSDGIRNNQELSVDCGGPNCPGCAVGELCSVGSDCASGICSYTQCRPSCSPSCKAGEDCWDHDDCVSRSCQSNRTCWDGPPPPPP